MAMGANSRIEQVIDDIYEFIESCKNAASLPDKADRAEG